MGYCMNQSDTKFYIAKDNVNKAAAAICALHGNETIADSSGRHYAWVERDFYKHSTLGTLMKEWRWDVGFDSEGNVKDLLFQGEKLGDDEILFQAIAPFVQEGSFIVMTGEDDTTWRWRFSKGKLFEDTGRVVFDVPEGE